MAAGAMTLDMLYLQESGRELTELCGSGRNAGPLSPGPSPAKGEGGEDGAAV